MSLNEIISLGNRKLRKKGTLTQNLAKKQPSIVKF